MVDIKGLDKARVLKALYDHGNAKGTGRFEKNDTTVTVEICEDMMGRHYRFDSMFGLLLNVDLSGDEFNESGYDRIYGAGAAQRAVDSIKGALENDEDAAKDADGEKKELTMKEKAKMADDALSKIMDILLELPPDVAAAASVVLKTVLPGTPMSAALLMMGGPFAPPPFRTFGTPMDKFTEPMMGKQITAKDLADLLNK